MFHNLKNNSGFTLIEILASVVLLTLVLSMFLSIFPQMANMNNRTGDNLEAANVGKELLVKVKNNSYSDYISSPASGFGLKVRDENVETIKNFNINNSVPSEDIIISGTYKSSGRDFNLEIRISRNEVLLPPNNITYQLHQVTVNVKNDNSASPLTTTYGYIDKN